MADGCPGGDGKKKKRRRNTMKTFRWKELSIVDRAAQTPALAVIAKRDVQKAMALTSLTAGHAHLVVGVQGSEGQLSELRAGKTSWVDNHQHDWVMDDAGNIIIADAEGHSHGLSVLVKHDLTEEQLAGLEIEAIEPASKAAEDIGDSGETVPMSNQNDKAAEIPKAVQEQLDQLTKRAERAEALAGLNDAEKAFTKGLDEEALVEFLALDSDARKGRLAKAAEKDAVVYTDDDGVEYRKSDDERLVSLAKRADGDRKKRRKMEEKAEKADLEKRARELPHLGDVETVSALLKSVDALPEEQRKSAIEALRKNGERLAKATETLGSSEGDSDGSEADPVEAIAQKLREANPELTKEQAYSKALDTPEGQVAFAKQRS